MACGTAGALLLYLLSASSLCAAELGANASKPMVAQVVALARIGSILCPDLDVDEQAVHELMSKAGITDKDVVDPSVYGSNDSVVTRSFAQSFLKDPGSACIQIYSAFGPGNGQLLRRGGRPI